ncbi:MAG: hypothetical protein EOP10_21890 [Proteobacteria bacterium]|nr:MAG: hypothetical protein EOP10_21890 [Pseudomonadota bacterium]
MRNCNDFDKYLNRADTPTFLQAFSALDDRRPVSVLEVTKHAYSWDIIIENGRLKKDLAQLRQYMGSTQFSLKPIPGTDRLNLQIGLCQNLPRSLMMQDYTAYLQQNTDQGFFLGLSAFGPKHWNLDHLTHSFFFGTTGFGKSNFLRSLLVQSAAFQSETINHIIDLKGIDFQGFEGSPGVGFIATSYGDVISLFDLILLEIKVRQTIFSEAWEVPPKSLKEYRSFAAESPTELNFPELPRIIIWIDEYNLLANCDIYHADNNMNDKIQHILRIGRAYGIHIMACSQKFNDFGQHMRQAAPTRFSTYSTDLVETDEFAEIRRLSKPIPGYITMENKGDQTESVCAFQSPYFDEETMQVCLQILNTRKDKWANKGFIKLKLNAESALKRGYGKIAMQGLKLDEIWDVKSPSRNFLSERMLQTYGEDKLIGQIHELIEPEPVLPKSEDDDMDASLDATH